MMSIASPLPRPNLSISPLSLSLSVQIIFFTLLPSLLLNFLLNDSFTLTFSPSPKTFFLYACIDRVWLKPPPKNFKEKLPYVFI